MLSKLRRLKRSCSKKLDPLPKRAPLQEQLPDHGLLKKRTPATDEVLSTSEVLHLIFAYLPPSTLILSIKRVCRTWYSVISNPSVDLQVSLFLRPAPDDSTLFTTPTTNDLLKSAFPFWLLEKKPTTKTRNVQLRSKQMWFMEHYNIHHHPSLEAKSFSLAAKFSCLEGNASYPATAHAARILEAYRFQKR